MDGAPGSEQIARRRVTQRRGWGRGHEASVPALRRRIAGTPERVDGADRQDVVSHTEVEDRPWHSTTLRCLRPPVDPDR